MHLLICSDNAGAAPGTGGGPHLLYLAVLQPGEGGA